ncbi:hypothetical protein [Sciscionella marina]|uniref:hypothetical protein n=1 Tax=Sciscionella marina TaxID=508770 RepID=UPI00036DE8C2|nr:hypothetical protein [Sciscionella marina]
MARSHGGSSHGSSGHGSSGRGSSGHGGSGNGRKGGGSHGSSGHGGSGVGKPGKGKGYSAQPQGLHNMSSKLSNLGSTLDNVAGKVSSAGPGHGAFGVVGQSFGGKITTVLESTGQRITGISKSAHGASRKVKRVAESLQENEEHNKRLFQGLDKNGGSGSRGVDPKYHRQGGGHLRPPGAIRPPQEHTQYTPPPGIANAHAGPTSEELSAIGKHWNRQNWLQAANKTQAYDSLEDLPLKTTSALNQHGISLRPGWWGHDPVIQAHGHKLTSYDGFVGRVSGKPDGGRQDAQHLHEWANGRRQFRDLPPHLKDMAAITHVAENGRGYTADVVNFNHEMGRIAQMNPQQAAQRWREMGEWFPPKHTAKTDGEYLPPPSP